MQGTVEEAGMAVQKEADQYYFPQVFCKLGLYLRVKWEVEEAGT